MLLRDAYRETAPELVAQEYARTADRILIGEYETFGQLGGGWSVRERSSTTPTASREAVAPFTASRTPSINALLAQSHSNPRYRSIVFLSSHFVPLLSVLGGRSRAARAMRRSPMKERGAVPRQAQLSSCLLTSSNCLITRCLSA